MHNITRQMYNSFLSRIADINGVTDATQKFNVTPNAEQKLKEKVQDSSPFLKLVNYEQVDHQEGEKIFVGVNSTIAGRTDTSDGKTERKPQPVGAYSSEKFRCEQTNFDTYIRYATLDAWRHDPNFQILLRAATSKQIARDQMMIGFNGTHAATNTNRVANPLLQDVNIGWLEGIRQGKAASVAKGFKIGAADGRDYKNADAAVYDAVNELVEPWHRESDLVVICGRKMLSEKYLHLLDSNDVPTERKALEGLMTSKMLGGLTTLAVPFFPEDAILITPLNNLSIYQQRGTTRLAYFDNPKLDRIEEFRSVNEGFVVEDYDACCLIEGIKTYNETSKAWE